MNWNLVSSTSEDETITNVFQKNHVFKLIPDAPLTEQVHVQSIVRNHRMIVSVNNNLYLLENEGEIECNTYCFESHIEAIELSSSGVIVICALKSGEIHGFHIQGPQVFSISVGEKDISENTTFIGISQTETNDYMFMCSTGSVYRLSNVHEENLSDINTANGETTIDASRFLLSGVELKKMIVNRENTNEPFIETFCVVADPQADLVVSSSKKDVYIQQDDRKYKIRIPKSVQSFKAFFNLDHYLIGLSSTGKIFEICLLTKAIHTFDELDYFIEDIVILQITDNDIQLLLKTKSNQGHHLKIVEFPSMKCNYDLPMTSKVHLVQQSQSSENVYYMEQISLNDSKHQEIIMNLILESEPSERLKKLIRIGRLNEAEKFAMDFKLSNQPILEARVRKLLIEISNLPKENTKLITDNQKKLLELVQKIKNTTFLLSLRCAEAIDKDTIQELLLLLLENVDFTNHGPELSDIKEQLLRLETLKLIDPFGIEFKWQSFVNHPNLFKFLTNLIESKNIDAACLIWKRHSSSLINRINSEFAKMSETLEPLQALQWYRHFVPYIIQKHPATMASLTDNAIRKMTLLQYLPDFPEIGITFIKDISLTFSEVQNLFSDEKRNFDGCIAKLSSTISVLQSLTVLKRTYNITLMYDDYVNNTIEENAFNILLRVHLNLLKDIATNFLFPIFFEKGMLPSDTIIRYIKLLVRGHKTIGFWEERAIAAIDLIYNTQNKLECALSVLRVAPVPWSETVTKLLKLGTSSHPLAVEVYNEYESQQLKILKIKYGWKVDSPGNILKLAFRIIKVNPEMVDDVRYLVKVDSTRSFAINSYYITTLLQQNRVEICFKYMSLLTESECEAVLEFIINVGNDTNLSDESMQEFFKYCTQRVNNPTLRKILLSREKLRTTFQLELTPTDMSYADVRDNHFKGGIETIINNLSTKDSNLLDSSFHDIVLLCTSLNFDLMKGVFELCKTLDNIHFTCGMAKTVLDGVTVNEHNYAFFVDLAMLLIGQQIKYFEAELLSSSNTFSYVLAYKLLQRSLIHGSVIYREVNELLTWSHIGCDIYSIIELETFLELKAEFDKNMLQDKLNETGDGSNDSFSVFESVRSPTTVAKLSNYNEEVLKCLSTAIHLLCTMEHHPFERINKHFQFNIDDRKKIIAIFKSSLDELIAKKPNIPFNIIQLFLKYQKLGDVIVIQDLFVKNVKRKIMYYGLLQKQPNFLDLSAVLMSDANPKELAVYLNKKLKNTPNYVDYLKLCEVCNVIDPNLNLDITIESIFKFQYYKELCKHDPSIKPQSMVDFQSFDNVLKTLENKVINVSLLKRMSDAFNWNYQKVLVTQILTILSSQELDYSISTDVFGKDQVVSKNSVDELCALCQVYISELICTKDLAKELYKFMRTINFYFYELHLCVIHILNVIKAIQPNMNWWQSILTFLKYKMIWKRRNPIGPIENEAWLTSHPLSGVLPPISKYRIPFLLPVDKTLADILNDEVNVEDFDKWFQLIELHAQMVGDGPDEISKIKDDFCLLAVKNALNDHKNKFKVESANYNLHPLNNEFLQSVLRLKRYMNNANRIFKMLHFTTKFVAEGADQVEAAHECFLFAENHEAELIKDRTSGKYVSEIKRQYPMYQTKYLLRLYNMSDDKLFQLVESPEELICQLYEHESILKDQKININKLAEEIAEVYKKNLKLIQLNLLKKWFCDTVTSSPMEDETICDYFDSSMDPDPMNLDIVTRACYILSQWSSEEAVEFCITYFDQPSPAKKLLAFECHMKLSNDEDEIMPSSQYIQIKCAYYLQQLGVDFRVLSQNNKIDLLKKIWKNHATDPRALEVIIFISLGYDIDHPKLWDSVLKQMVNLKMTKQLSAIIELVSRRKELRKIDDGFVAAWEYLIKEPFECAITTRSPEQEAKLVKSLFLCQTCPVVSKIDLVEIARQFLRLERWHMAAVLLIFCNDLQKTQIIEMINNTPNLMKDELTSLTEFGIYAFVIDFAVEELNL